jgi:hypothetical protein
VDYIVIPERQNAFNTAYWAAKSPAARKAAELGIPDRQEAMTALAQSGLSIDRQIDIMGYDPYETMLTRLLYGYTWVPSALQMITFPPPGFALPGQTPYDPDHPPPGSIAVHDPNTFDLAAWYPPFDPPPPVAPAGLSPAPPSMIDFSQPWPEKNGWFSTQAGYPVPAGQEHDEGGKAYLKIVMPWPFGAYHGWSLK